MVCKKLKSTNGQDNVHKDSCQPFSLKWTPKTVATAVTMETVRMTKVHLMINFRRSFAMVRCMSLSYAGCSIST